MKYVFEQIALLALFAVLALVIIFSPIRSN